MEKKEILVEGIKSTGRLYCKSGRRNAYRDAFFKGQGASRRDPTWSKEKKMHTCCNSHLPWRHYAKCLKAARNAPDDLSDIDLSKMSVSH